MSPHEHSQFPGAFDGLLEPHLMSVGTIELLMLLHHDADRTHDLEKICDALSCPRSWAELQLDGLRRAGLVEGDQQDGYRYAPSLPRQARAVEDLAAAWRDDRVRISRRIFSSAHPPRRRRAQRRS